jgi:putative transcriptional regulator
MSESDIVRVRSLPDGSAVQIMSDGSTRPIEDRTDWALLEAMTEEEIEANALSDPDNPPLTDEELARMRRVPDPERIRRQLGLTQAEFAEQFEISLPILRAWEQRERWLDTAAITLLRIIEQDPDAVRAALQRSYEPRLRPTGD